MIICGILGIFYLCVFIFIFFAPIFLKETQNTETRSEGRALLWWLIWYVGTFTIAKFVFEALDEISGCYVLNLI